MAFTQRDNSGALFRNEKREKDTHPTHQGTCTIDGKQFYISAWIREAQGNGQKFFSLAFKPKLAKDHAGAVAHKTPVPATAGFSDDIPFAWFLLIPLGGLLAYVFAAQNLFQV